MEDSSDLIEIKPQPADDFSDDVTNGRLFWQCESYDEYRLHCTIEGIEPLYTRREFDEMKSSLNISHLMHLSRLAKYA